LGREKGWNDIRGGENMAGRPTNYKKEYDEQAYKLCLLGATDKEMADFFNVKEQTINNWKKNHPSFFESIKRGKIVADANVAKSLYHRALGYSHPEDKIFNDNGEPLIVPTVKHYPPDPTAAIFWLKNRKPAEWRDKRDVQVEGGMTFSIKPAPPPGDDAT